MAERKVYGGLQRAAAIDAEREGIEVSTVDNGTIVVQLANGQKIDAPAALIAIRSHRPLPLLRGSSGLPARYDHYFGEVVANGGRAAAI